MPLKLVTGPANSGKAGELLRAYRRRLDDDPILVVPRLEDVEHTRRERAEEGATLGVRVVRFGGLLELIAARARTGTGGLGLGGEEALASRVRERLGVPPGGEHGRRIEEIPARAWAEDPPGDAQASLVEPLHAELVA